MNRTYRPLSLTLVLSLLTAGMTWAEERDIFDYEGQRKTGPDVKKIVFIGDAGTHGPRGNHEFVAGSILLARELRAAYPQVHAVVYSSKNWPKDLSHADAIIVGLNHGQKAATDPNGVKLVRNMLRFQ